MTKEELRTDFENWCRNAANIPNDMLDYIHHKIVDLEEDNKSLLSAFEAKQKELDVAHNQIQNWIEEVEKFNKLIAQNKNG